MRDEETTEDGGQMPECGERNKENSVISLLVEGK